MIKLSKNNIKMPTLIDVFFDKSNAIRSIPPLLTWLISNILIPIPIMKPPLKLLIKIGTDEWVEIGRSKSIKKDETNSPWIPL